MTFTPLPTSPPHPRASWRFPVAAWCLLVLLPGAALAGIAQVAPVVPLPGPPKPDPTAPLDPPVIDAPILEQGRYRHEACMIDGWTEQTGQQIAAAFGLEVEPANSEECLMIFDRWYYALRRPQP